MKKTILLMLPFALGLAACSGGSPLDKGNIITPKFMERNFVDTTEPVELSRDYSVDEIYEFGTFDPAKMAPITNNYNFWKVEDDDGKIGVYSLSAKKLIVEPGEYTLNDDLFTDYYPFGGQRLYFAIYGALDTENETASWHVVDELGNEVFTMETDIADYPYIDDCREIYEFEKQSENEYLVVLAGSYNYGVEEQFVVYNIDYTVSRKGKLSEFGDNSNYAFGYHNTMEAYGHPELAMVQSATASGFRNSFYNVEEKKFVASFPFNADAQYFVAGDFVVMQELNAVEERATDYDLYLAGNKFNVTTTKMNYTNGKVETIDTKVLFVLNETSRREVADEKGVIKYHYFEDARVIRDDKTLENQVYGFIFDESLNIAADVTGISFNNLVKLGDYYFDWVNRIVYDGKLNEVSYFPTLEEINEYGVVFEDPDEYYVGIATLDGKTIVPAKYSELEFVYQNVILFSDVDGFGSAKIEDGQFKELVRFSWDEYSVAGAYDIYGYTYVLEDSEGEYSLLNTFNGTTSEMFELPEGETALGVLGSTSSGATSCLGVFQMFDYAIQRADGSIYVLRTSVTHHYGFLSVAAE